MPKKVGYVAERASHSPPSTTRIAPVTQLAAGEARNATAFAMSRGAAPPTKRDLGALASGDRLLDAALSTGGVAGRSLPR